MLKPIDLTEKIPFTGRMRLYYRAVRVWYANCPWLLVWDMFLGIYESLIPYVGIWLSARLIDELSGQRRVHTLITIIACILGSTLLFSVIRLICSRISAWVATRMTNRADIIKNEKINSLDFCLLDDPTVHEMLSMADDGINRFAEVTAQAFGCIHSMIAVFGGIGLCASLFASRMMDAHGALAVLDMPVTTVVFMLFIILLSFWNTFCHHRRTKHRRVFDQMVKQRQRAYFYWMRSFPWNPARDADARLYRQDEIFAQAVQKNEIYGKDGIFNVSRLRILIWFWDIISVVGDSAAQMLAYLYVCLKALGGAFGVGSVTQYVSSITSIFNSIDGCIGNAQGLTEHAPYLRAAFAFLDIENVMDQGSLSVEKRTDMDYEIEFRDVSFRYPGAKTWALRHLNLRFRVGERLAVVGRNGSGKSTFIKLLCRMYDPTEGEILLNGINIRKYDYREYLSVFSVVFQDFTLFALPLGQNVSSAVDFDRERVDALLREAGFGDRLDALPDGADTYLYKNISDNGVNVSGGEAQKIALARALYKGAPFIILDEPTAALDPVAEYDIYTRFNDMVGKRTAIYISHRLASCRFCDDIAVFENGALVQHGTHEALLADESGPYHTLWNAQAQYYK